MTKIIEIARLDDIDASAVSNGALTLASLARNLGYVVQWHVNPITSKCCDPRLLDALISGDELWLHGVHHEPKRPHPIDQVVAQISNLEDVANHIVQGFSIPFGYVPPDSWLTSLKDVKLSLLAPPIIRKCDELCIDICAWPGPTLRNLLQVHQRAKVAAQLDRRWGLALHPGRLLKHDEEYVLRSAIAQWSLNGLLGLK